MTYLVDDKINALAFSQNLLTRQIQLAGIGVFNDTAKQLLSIAHDRDISVGDAYVVMMDNLTQSEKKHSQAQQAALNAYDRHIAEHKDEIDHLNKQIKQSEHKVVQLEQDITRNKNLLVDQKGELKKKNFSDEQIEKVLSMNKPFDEHIVKTEIQELISEVNRAKQRVSQIYATAKEVQLEIYYNQ